MKRREATSTELIQTTAKGAATIKPEDAHVAMEFEHTSPFICCRLDPQGRFAFGSAEDSRIQRWNIATGAKTELQLHDSWIFAMALLPDGETLISAGGDGRVVWWPASAEKPEPSRVVQGHPGWIRFVAVSPDGQRIASAGSDRVVRLWNAVDGTLEHELTGHKLDVYSVAFHPSGEFLISGDLLGEVRQWEAKTGKYMRSCDAKALHTYNGGQGVHYGGVRDVCVSLDGQRLSACGLHRAPNPLAGVNEPIALVFDWESGEKVEQFEMKGVRALAWRAIFHASGFLIGGAGGHTGGYILFWKNGETDEVHRFVLPNTARSMDLHPSGVDVLTGHYDNKVRLTRLTKKPADDPQAAQKPDA